ANDPLVRESEPGCGAVALDPDHRPLAGGVAVGEDRCHLPPLAESMDLVAQPEAGEHLWIAGGFPPGETVEPAHALPSLATVRQRSDRAQYRWRDFPGQKSRPGPLPPTIPTPPPPSAPRANPRPA